MLLRVGSFHGGARDALLLGCRHWPRLHGLPPAHHRQSSVKRLTGQFIASKSESALTSALGDMGITKELHVYHIVAALMRLKSGDEGALAAASSHSLS